MTGRREFLAGALALPLVARADLAAVIGLPRGENGGVRLHGAPYRGVGVNYFDVFLRQLQARDDKRVDAGFRTLAAVWVYDYARQPDFNLMPGSPRAYQLERIGAWNRDRCS